MPKLVIFDWDGTLVDSIDPILRGFELAYRRAGHPCPSADDLRRTIGLPLAVAFEQLSPGLPAPTMVTLYREYWFSPERPPSPWVDGALETMEWLDRRGIPMAIATGKSRRGVDHELQALSVADRFIATRSADDAQAKPHPDMIMQLLEQLHCPPDRALVVGDSPLDLAMAAAAGVPAYGVLGGVGRLEDLARERPLDVLASIAALPDRLLAAL
jgi:phosphoglycolate phosphatase